MTRWALQAPSCGTLIADDLTGACDAAAPFAGRGPVGVFVWPASPGREWEVAAVDTESRGLAADEAAGRVRAAVERLGARRGGLLFKKIDSTLRGPIGPEVETLLSASGRSTALVCPTFPGQGRTVVHGTLRVAGVPAHESPVGRDPAYPGPTSRVAEILGRGAARPVSHLSLGQVRGPREALLDTLARARGHIVVADAEADEDLAAVAAAGLGVPGIVLAGSAGLAGAVARMLGRDGPPPALPAGRAWLVVAGSAHPATRAQVDALAAAGVPGARVEGPGDPDTRPLVACLAGGRPVFLATGDRIVASPGARTTIAGRLARVAAGMLAEARPDLVAVTGGETAVALLGAAGATRVEISGAPRSGLALGAAVVGVGSSVPLLTKAGGFGPPDLFLTLLDLARGEASRRPAAVRAEPS